MKKVFLLIILLFIPFMISAEELKMEWQKSFGGSKYDSFSDFILTENGDIIVYGHTRSTDIDGIETKENGVAVTVKYDKNGNLLWQKSFGGSGYNNFTDFIVTNVGEIIASGYTNSTDIEGLNAKGNQDAFIVKYDKDGNLLWQKIWGGSDNDSFSEFIVTETGDIIVFGNTKSIDIEGLTIKGNQDIVLVKYDKDGNLLWQKSWGGSDEEEFKNNIITKSGDIIAYGHTNSTDIEGLTTKGNHDMFILKYDKNGNLLWQKSFGGSKEDFLYKLIETNSEEIMVYGYTYSTDIDGLPNNGNRDAIIIKYDKNGNLLWQKNFGGSGEEYFYNMIVTQTGDVIASGYTYSTDIEGLTLKGIDDAIIVKYDKDGNLLWQKIYGGSQIDVSLDSAVSKTGDIIVYIHTTSVDIEGLTLKGNIDTIIVKYDKEGNMLWQKSFGGSGTDVFFDIQTTENEDIIAMGHTDSTDIENLSINGKRNAIIVKYDKNGNLLWQKSFGGSEYDSFSKIKSTEYGNIIAYGYTKSTNIEGLTNKGDVDAVIVKYSIEYNMENITTQNGVSTIEQQGKYGIITPTPNVGYEVNEIIVKDKNGDILDIEVTKLEDGTYSFPLYSDVSVEVLFKEVLSNPKTGIIDYISFILVGMLICTIGYISINQYNKRFEL